MGYLTYLPSHERDKSGCVSSALAPESVRTRFSGSASPFTLPFFLDTARSTTASTFLGAAAGTAAALLLLRIERHVNGYTALQHDFDRVLRDIDSDNFTHTAGGVKHGADLGHLLFRLNIVIIFVREATHQATTDAGDFCGIKRKTLLFG